MPGVPIQTADGIGSMRFHYWRVRAPLQGNCFPSPCECNRSCCRTQVQGAEVQCTYDDCDAERAMTRNVPATGMAPVTPLDPPSPSSIKGFDLEHVMHRRAFRRFQKLL